MTLEMPTIPLPLVERRELDDLLRPTTHAVRHAGFRNGVVVPRVDVGKGDNLQVVRVPRCAAAVRNVHVRKFVVCELERSILMNQNGSRRVSTASADGPPEMGSGSLGGLLPGRGRPGLRERRLYGAGRLAARGSAAPSSSGCRAMIQRLGRAQIAPQGEAASTRKTCPSNVGGGGLRRAEERVSGMKA